MSALTNKPGGGSREENYYLDPGYVNIHQFYPVLELTFGKQEAIMDEECFPATPEMGSQLENATEDNKGTDVQAEVFSTAVNEESIEAAKERSQKMKDWRIGGPQKIRGSAKIVAQRTNECFQIAMRMKDDGNLIGAVTSLTKAINLRHDDPVFFVERGEIYLSLGDFQSAILNYKKACLLATNSTTYQARLAFIFHFQGQVLFDLRLFAEALESFSRASEMFPDNFGYQMRCISCLAALQRHGECLALVNKSLEDNKTKPDLYIVRARLNEFFANMSLCYQDVKEALSLNPTHSEGQTMMEAIIKRTNSYKQLAMQLCIKGQDREALQKISMAIITNPGEADYHVLRGALHRKLKDFNAAVDDFLLALDKCGHKEEDPVFHNAQRQLLLTFNDFAVDCFHKSCYTEAITLLNKALNEEKREKSLYVNRGDCFFKQDELNFALQDYQQALDLDPQDPSIKFRISLVYNELGVRLFQDKNYSDAENKFSMAITLCPLVGHYYISRCRTRYLNEKLPEAREDFLRGLLLSPTSEGITSISSRLFPGRSLAEIVNSPVGMDTRRKLASLLPAGGASPPTGNRNYLNTDGNAESEEPAKSCAEVPVINPSAEISAASTGFVMCMGEREFYMRQAYDKRKVGHRVKDAFLNNRSLRYDGPQISPFPLITREHNGSPQGQKHFLATSTGKDKSSEQSATSWRNFGMSITRN